MKKIILAFTNGATTHGNDGWIERRVAIWSLSSVVVVADENEEKLISVSHPSFLSSSLRTRMVQRHRTTIPQELEDPEDLTIGEAEGEMFDEMHQQRADAQTIITDGSATQQQAQALRDGSRWR